jgi:hypothetical protein
MCILPATIVATAVLLLVYVIAKAELAVAVKAISAAPKVCAEVKAGKVMVCAAGGANTLLLSNVYALAFIAIVCDKPKTIMKMKK